MVDVDTGSVLWTSTVSSAGSTYTRGGRLFAVISKQSDGSVGVLDFESGTVTLTDGATGGLRVTASGFVFSEPGPPSGIMRTIWLDTEGQPTLYIEIPTNDRQSTLLDDVFLQIITDDTGSTLRAFETPQ